MYRHGHIVAVMDDLESGRSLPNPTARAATMDLILKAIENLAGSVDLNQRRGRLLLASAIHTDLIGSKSISTPCEGCVRRG